jgi:integral membrane protein
VPDFADSPTTELERKARTLRIVCPIETITYLGLVYFWVTGSDVGLKILGSLHGTIFLGFAAMVVGIARPMHWTWKWLAVVLLAGPIGPLIVYERLRREGVPPEHRSVPATAA